MATQIQTFIELIRLNKPIGIMLLFWPSAWSLVYSYSLNNNLNQFLYYLLLFFLGSILMRSAGCIVNDIVDRNFDIKVKRTKKRPLAAKKISIQQASIYAGTLCLMAFFILIQFNQLTIYLGLASMLLAFLYPFMKRVTYWPQLFLGITFNWGIVMAWTAVNNNILVEILYMYVAAIFWTIGYDTIYGSQDIKEDEIIGIKSTAIKFKKNLKLFVLFNYLACSFLFIFLFKNEISNYLFLLFIILFILSLMYQVKIFNKLKANQTLFAFKLNNTSGLLLFLAILSTTN